MYMTEKHHKDTLQQMEHKFFEEKVLATSLINKGLVIILEDSKVHPLCL